MGARGAAVEAFFGGVKLSAWTRDPRALTGSLVLAVVVNAPLVIATVPALVIVSDAVFGLAFFVLINWASSFRERVLRPRWIGVLAGVGLFSYSLYLTNEPVLGGAKHLGLLVGLTEGPAQTIAMLMLRLAVALSVAYLFYRLIEVRAIRASRRLRTPVVASAPSPVVV